MNLSENLEKIKSIYTYEYNENEVKKIIENFKTSINNNTFKLMEMLSDDSKLGMEKVTIKNISNLIDKISKEKFLLNQENYALRQVDGTGNIAVVYNGNPAITISLILKALKTHNNIILFPENISKSNNYIINLLNEVIQKQKYNNNIINIFDNNDIENDGKNVFDKIIVIGEKTKYNSIKKKFDIPIVYSGYGYVSIYTDNIYFKDILKNIDEYVFENNIILEYYNNKDLSIDIPMINSVGSNDIVAIFTKNSKKAFSFLNEIKAKKIYINKNPFNEYEFEFDDSELIIRKEIIK